MRAQCMAAPEKFQATDHFEDYYSGDKGQGEEEAEASFEGVSHVGFS
jgi:hypothetical protein